MAATEIAVPTARHCAFDSWPRYPGALGVYAPRIRRVLLEKINIPHSPAKHGVYNGVFKCYHMHHRIWPEDM